MHLCPTVFPPCLESNKHMHVENAIFGIEKEMEQGEAFPQRT